MSLNFFLPQFLHLQNEASDTCLQSLTDGGKRIFISLKGSIKIHHAKCKVLLVYFVSVF